MKFLRKFNEHTSYEAELNSVGVDISLPNVSYCEDVKDVHYTPYNLVRFYVGEITPPQTVKIYTDKTTSIPIQVSEGNKWYSYVLPKDKGLYKISGNTVTKVIVKANISYTPSGVFNYIIPKSTIEASFKGSNTSNVTNMNMMLQNCSGLTSLDLSGLDTSKVIEMSGMFMNCSGLTSLDLSGWDTSKVINMSGMFGGCKKLKSLDLSKWDTSKVTMNGMFDGCAALNKITMIGCKQPTIDKIKERLTADGISLDNVKITT